MCVCVYTATKQWLLSFIDSVLSAANGHLFVLCVRDACMCICDACALCDDDRRYILRIPTVLLGTADANNK